MVARAPSGGQSLRARGTLEGRIELTWKQHVTRWQLWRHRTDLVYLARHFATDKWGRHWYARHYQHHFAPRRTDRLTVLEIGVGGYHELDKGGASLRLWKAYFPNARIFGLDLFDKRGLEEDRIRIVQGSQDDPSVIESLVAETGPLDIVIDDGSHDNVHVRATFELLFPHLRDGGIYVVEDLQTSYWPKFRGSLDPEASTTSMAFFKRLADGLNHAERIEPGYTPTFLDLNVKSLHFYHNMVFVYRGANDEGSNLLKNNVAPDWIR
jgi:methyltransferase family protein